MIGAGDLQVDALGRGREAVVQAGGVGRGDHRVGLPGEDHCGHPVVGQVRRRRVRRDADHCLQRRSPGGCAQRATAAHGVTGDRQPAGVDAVAHRALLGEVVQCGEQLGASRRVEVVTAVGLDADHDEAVGGQPRPHPGQFRGEQRGVTRRDRDGPEGALAGVGRVVDPAAVEAVPGRHADGGVGERAVLGGDAGPGGIRAPLVRVVGGRRRPGRQGDGEQSDRGGDPGRGELEQASPQPGGHPVGVGRPRGREVACVSSHCRYLLVVVDACGAGRLGLVPSRPAPVSFGRQRCRVSRPGRYGRRP